MSSIKIIRAGVLAGLLVAGCAVNPPSVAQYFTTADIALRSGQEDDSSVVAILPRGTPVVPAGPVGSHCNACWKVETPAGTGWVYTTYLAMRLSDIGP